MLMKSIKLPWLLLFFAIILLNSGCAVSNRAVVKKSNTVIQTARSYTGVPYKYGGTTRVGIDCSALLLHSFKSVKVKLPRVSADQAKVGEKVKIKDLKPGDMLFFATGKKKNAITHAGIVTSVKGKKQVMFIHASTSLGVMSNSRASSA